MDFSAVLQKTQWRKYFHRNYLYLIGIVCGIVIGRLLPGIYLAGFLLVSLTALLFFGKLYRELLMLVLATAAGLLAVGYQKYNTTTFRNDRLENAVVKITDSSAVGLKHSSDEQRIKRINAKSNGKNLQLYIPEQLQNIVLSDGKKYRVSGNFSTPAPPPEFFLVDKQGKWQNASNQFRRSNYHDYLARNGIGGILYLEKIEPLPESQPSRLALIRRELAQRLDRNINDPVSRAIISAVTLGLRHRLTGPEKRHYASVGLAHLFSVSGLHVGVLAAIILLLMRPLPQWLQIPATGTLICYVFLTGNNAPAIRAFAMILLLVIFRSYFLRCRPLEVLSIICGVLLLTNPLYLTDGGFLYSFVITALLIKSSEWIRDVMRTFAGVENITGNLSLARRFLTNCKRRLAGAVFFAASASAASAALTLFFQNMFFAGSMLVNLLILPILLPMYLLSIGKMLLPQWADFWNIILNFLVEYLKFIARIGNEFASNSELMHISYLTVLLFTILLMLFFTLAYKKAASALLAVILLTICIMYLKSGTAPRQVHALIWGGRMQHPTAAVILPQAHTMYLLNCSRDAVMPLLDIAAFYGISQIDRLDFGNPVAGCSNGVDYLRNNLQILEYRKSNLPIRSKVFKEHTEKLVLMPGAQTASLSSSKLASHPEIKFNHLPDGTLALYSSNKKYTIERSKYPKVYIVECD